MTCPAIEFDAATHTYTVNGEEWPSVTTIIREAGLCDTTGWNEFVATRGTHVHEACRLVDCGDLDDEVLDPRLRGYVAAWRKFAEAAQWKPERAEVVVASSAGRYAGTLDRIGEAGGKRLMLDIKTGSPQPWHGIQLAAYMQCDGMYIMPRMGVYLRADGTYSTKSYKDINDRHIFNAAVSLWHWKKEHGLCRQ